MDLSPLYPAYLTPDPKARSAQSFSWRQWRYFTYGDGKAFSTGKYVGVGKQTVYYVFHGKGSDETGWWYSDDSASPEMPMKLSIKHPVVAVSDDRSGNAN